MIGITIHLTEKERVFIVQNLSTQLCYLFKMSIEDYRQAESILRKLER